MFQHSPPPQAIIGILTAFWYPTQGIMTMVFRPRSNSGHLKYRFPPSGGREYRVIWHKGSSEGGDFDRRHFLMSESPVSVHGGGLGIHIDWCLNMNQYTWLWTGVHSEIILGDDFEGGGHILWQKHQEEKGQYRFC